MARNYTPFVAAAATCNSRARWSGSAPRLVAKAWRAAERHSAALAAALELQRSRLQRQPWHAGQAAAQSLQRARSLAEQALLLAAGLAAALSLQLGGAAGAAQAYQLDADLSSVAEDSLLQLMRRVDAVVDGAVDAVREAAGAGGSAGSSPEEESREARELVQEVWEVVDLNFADVRNGGFDRARWAALRDRALQRPLQSRAAAYGAIREMLASLNDPYSRFISPTEFQSMLKYDVSGVGLNLGTAEEFANKTGLALPADRSAASGGTWVVGLIRGSPADAAGLRQGDELLELEGQALGSRTPFEVASLLQAQQAEEQEQQPQGSAGGGGGVPGLQSSPVRLRVRHLDGSSEALTLARPVRVVRSPVSSRLEEGREGAVGYVQLSSFNARAQRDTLAAVKALEASGAQRLVLDLRDNRGGLVTEGVEVARLFLEDDALIVRTEGKARASAAPITAPGPAASRAPLVVLVNDHTASASEILAGALRDNCRAVLVGGRTYGKGLIQSVYELHDGSGLALTVGKYVSPNGTDIDREGLAPDFRRMPSPAQADAAVAACRLSAANRSGGGAAGRG